METTFRPMTSTEAKRAYDPTIRMASETTRPCEFCKGPVRDAHDHSYYHYDSIGCLYRIDVLCKKLTTGGTRGGNF